MIAELNKEKILSYCDKHSNKDSDLLNELIEYTFKNELAPQMISGTQVGNVLQSLIMISGSKKILEIGTCLNNPNDDETKYTFYIVINFRNIKLLF